MVDINGFTQHIGSLFAPTTFTAQVSGNEITISGPAGKPFSVDIKTDGTITATQTHIQTAVKPVPEQQATGGFSIYAGKQTPSSLSKNLRYGQYQDQPGITAIYVGGVDILGLSPGSAIYYNSYSQNAWNDRGQKMAITIAYYINLNSPQSGFTAKYWASGGWSGPDLGGFSIIADPERGASPNGDKVEIEFESEPQDINSEFWQLSTRQKSPYAEDPLTTNLWIADCGVMSDGLFTGIKSITIDGVEVLEEDSVNSGVAWEDSHSATAMAVADQVNIYTSTPEYLAEGQEGGRVKFTAEPGLGDSANGRFILVTTAGTCGVNQLEHMAGGTDAISGVSQKTLLTVGGTFSAGSKLTVTMTLDESPNYPVQVGATLVGNSLPVHVLTYKSKVHLLSEQYLFSSALDNPRKWDEVSLGTSVIDMSNNVEGSEELISATPYQGKLAIFGRRSCQVWNIDVDPSKNFQAQVLTNTGAVSSQSVISFGEIDSFYLSDSGVRSLRSRDSSTNAYSTDVGLPIDTLLVEAMRSAGSEQSSKSVCAIEPLDNRLMVSIGSKIYVLSQFSGSNLYAWSTYEPGFSISRMVVVGGRLYVKSGNTIYLYGGADNNTYDNCELELILPYLDGGKPAHSKSANGIDLTIDGQWTLQMGMDPFSPETRDTIATVSTSTFSLGRITAVGRGTHFGLRLISNANGYARLANVFVHYELNEAD